MLSCGNVCYYYKPKEGTKKGTFIQYIYNKVLTVAKISTEDGDTTFVPNGYLFETERECNEFIVKLGMLNLNVIADDIKTSEDLVKFCIMYNIQEDCLRCLAVSKAVDFGIIKSFESIPDLEMFTHD